MRPPSTRGAGDQKYPPSLHCHTPLRTLGLPDKGHRRSWKAVGTALPEASPLHRQVLHSRTTRGDWLQ